MSPSSSCTRYRMWKAPAVMGVPLSVRVPGSNVSPGTLGDRLYVRVPLPPVAAGNVSFTPIPSVYALSLTEGRLGDVSCSSMMIAKG